MFSKDDAYSLTISTMHAIFITLYLFYILFIIFLRKYFKLDIEICQKLLLLIPLNFVCQIAMWICGIAYFMVFKSTISNIPKLLLIISSSTIFMIDLCLIALTIISIIQINNSDREACSCFVPLLRWEKYFNIPIIQSFIYKPHL